MKPSNTRKTTQPRLNPLTCPENMTLEQWQCALRRQAAEKEHLGVTPPHRLLDYFVVSNPESKQRYNVTFRGVGSRWNYCSCPDFRTSGLGTCKHIEAVAIANDGKYSRRSYPQPSYTSVYVDYRDNRKIKIRIGTNMQMEYIALASELFNNYGELSEEAYLDADIDSFIARATALDERFRWHRDALQLIADKRDRESRRRIVAEKYASANLDGLLNTCLYPYQADGIRFAFTNGRTIIADDMGLGKTIQAIGAACMLSREGFIDTVLIVCPTSLKFQWQSEIKRFTGMEAMIVEGNLLRRREMLADKSTFFKICSYHALANNIKAGDTVAPDMVIFDEVQRLKNWNTQIARNMRRIEAQYVLALSGTPLENRLMELYSVMQLVDQYTLGPFYRFNDETTLVDETGKVLGYKNLHAVAKRMGDTLIRRLKKDVALQMPRRTDTNMFVPMTNEQSAMHTEYHNTVAQIIAKWQRLKFLTEADRRRLLLSLSMMRMVCDSTFILDQSSRFDTKIDIALDLIADKLEGSSEKIVVFSEWERMLRILASELEQRGLQFSFLHGGVPSAKRGALIERFCTDPDCRIFLSTDAGGTGLNLQAASLLINLDLPWNPAVLEQRIARIYRLKQQLPVQIINLVARGTIEEQMLDKLSFKSRMAAGILDSGEDTVMNERKTLETIRLMFTDDSGETDTAALPDDTADEQETELPIAEAKESEGDIRRSLASEEADGDEPQQPDLPSPSLSEAERDTTAHSREGIRNTVADTLTALGSLADMLRSPQTTQQLVDALVTTDEATGQTHIDIPVKDKQTVANIFTAIGALLNR